MNNYELKVGDKCKVKVTPSQYSYGVIESIQMDDKLGELRYFVKLNDSPLVGAFLKDSIELKE